MLISAGVIGTALVLTGFGMYALAGRLGDESDRIAKDRKLVSERSAVIEVLNDLKNIAPETDPYQRALDALLPDEEQLLGFPKYLDGLARVFRLSLTFGFRVSQNSGSSAGGSVPFDASIVGSIDDIEGFLRNIETGSTRFLMAVDGFSLGGEGSSYKVSFSGRVFVK